MSSVVNQLVGMGFVRERAEKAVAETGGGSLETAVDWIVSHEKSSSGNENQVPDPSAPADSSLTVGSYLCNDCKKVMKDENSMMFHASKTGHENFSESTESVKPLTEEERKEAVAKLKEKIRERLAVKAEQEKKEEHEKELRRIAEGKKTLELREKQRDMEQLAAIEARKREKDETAAAKQRILDQIKQDKEDRKAAAAGFSALSAPPPPTTTAPLPTAPTRDYDQTTLQIRLPDGSALRQNFGAKEELSAVRLWLSLQRPELGNFDLIVPFPRKTFAPEDYGASLTHHGLVPTGTVVVTRSA